MKIPIVLSTILVLLATDICAKGLGVVKAQSYHDDATANVFVFESVSTTSAIVTFNIKGQKPYSVVHSDKVAYVDLIDKIGDITNDYDIQLYKKSVAECKAFAGKYRKSEPLLTPYIEMIAGVVQKYDDGMVKKSGEWMERGSLRVENQKKPNNAIKWETLTLRDGKTYRNVQILEKMPHGISIMFDNGAARIPYEKLSSQTQKELGGFDEQEAQEARKRDKARQAIHRKNMMISDAKIKKRKMQIARDEKIKEMEKRASFPAQVKVIQTLDNGVLCKIKRGVWTPDIRTSRHKDSFGNTQTKQTNHGNKWRFGGISDNMVFIESDTTDVFDNDWRQAWLLEQEEGYSYISVLNAPKKVRRYKVIASPYDDE
jgi:hypothetical protein